MAYNYSYSRRRQHRHPVKFIGNEGSLHFQGIVDLCPVFQSQINGAGAQVGAANANLADGGELLTGSVGNLTGMHLICKISNLLLLTQVERTLVDTISNHVLAQLTTAQVMQHPPLFTGVDDLAIIKRSKLLGQRALGMISLYKEEINHDCLEKSGYPVFLSEAGGR